MREGVGLTPGGTRGGPITGASPKGPFCVELQGPGDCPFFFYGTVCTRRLTSLLVQSGRPPSGGRMMAEQKSLSPQ